MPPSIYISPLISLVLVNSQGQSFPLGMAQNFRLQKQFTTQAIMEIGNYEAAEIVLLARSGTFSWGRAWQRARDWVAEGIVPADATMPQYDPFTARIIDTGSQRLIALLSRAVPNSYEVAIDNNGVLNNNISGICISVLTESELN